MSVHNPNWLTLRWRIKGAKSLTVPPFGGKARDDDLWRTTCFELFVRGIGTERYTEFNLSPSERWAAYDFSGYREGRADAAMPRTPVCTWRGSGDIALFDAAIPRAALPPLPALIGLSAVIEEAGGTKSYWALAHPDGPPDFHDLACFALTLAAPAMP